MRRFVNDLEVDLNPTGTAKAGPDGLILVDTPEGKQSALAVSVGESLLISFRGQQFVVDRRNRHAADRLNTGTGELHAPMPGQIVAIRAEEGQVVDAGAVVLVLEAMKTQQPQMAPFFGRVSAIHVKLGDQVQEGDLLALIEKSDS